MIVLNAFNSGGAQIGGTLDPTEFEIADDLDISAGKHALRAGFLVEGGRYRSNVRRNATGTFTFSSLDAFAAGRRRRSRRTSAIHASTCRSGRTRSTSRTTTGVRRR